MDRELLLELKSFLAERMVDNMTTEDLAEYVQDDLFQYFDKQGEHDFLEEAENYWGDMFGEVIDEEQPFRSGLRFKSTGVMDDRWYNWRVHNWGTKWDAYTMEIDDTDMPHGFEVNFETAWSPPEEICNAIREQYDDLSISWFYDEPGCEIAGYL